VLGAVLGLIVGNGPVMQFTFGVFLKPIADEFGADRGTISSAILVGLCLTGVMTPVAGRLIDRYGIRTITLPAVALFAGGTALLGMASSPFVFIALYGLLGVVAAGQTPLPYAKAVSSAFDERRGLALGVSMAGVGLGTALLPQIAQALVTNFGWRAAYAGLGCVVFLVAFPAVALLIREPGREMREARRLEMPGMTAAEALRSRDFWTLAVAFFFVALAAAGVIAHVVPLLTDRGVPAQTATGAISAAGIALIFGRLLAGYALDRIFAPYVAFVFFFSPLVGIALLYFVAHAPLAILAAVLVGVGLGAEVDLIAFLLSRYLGMKSFGEIYGYLFAVFMLGSGSGPFLMGVTYQATGSYNTGLIVLGAGLILASLLVLRLGRYRYGGEPVADDTPLNMQPSQKGL
jgi:predicted MFS family arabinose efflux permease